MTARFLLPLLFACALLATGLAAPVHAQQPVKLGVLTPLSPPGNAAAGQFSARGARMAALGLHA